MEAPVCRPDPALWSMVPVGGTGLRCAYTTTLRALTRSVLNILPLREASYGGTRVAHRAVRTHTSRDLVETCSRDLRRRPGLGRGHKCHVVLDRGHIVQLLQLVYRRVVERHVLLQEGQAGVRVRVRVKEGEGEGEGEGWVGVRVKGRRRRSSPQSYCYYY